MSGKRGPQRSAKSPRSVRRRGLRPKAAGTLVPVRPDWLIHHPWLREAGVMVTPETASQVSAVYGCCRLIVDCLAPAPVTVTEIKPKGVHETLYDDDVAYTLNYGAPVALAPDAPTSQAIEEALYWSALLHDGNGYAEIQRDGAGKFFALWPIEPGRVLPRRIEGELWYEIRQPEGGIAYLHPWRMFHLRGPSLYGLVGDSPIYRAAKAIGLAHASQIFSAAYFANGTVLSGYLKTPKTMAPDQKKRHGEQWKENWGGPDKAHGTPILDQGMEYQSLNHKAQESQLVESRRFQVQEIARFFGVPTTLLADNEAWTNLSELYLGFYRNALRPWAERFDAEATRKLFPQRKPWRIVQHDLTHLTIGSFKDQVSALREAVSAGIWTRNEARESFGKNHAGPEGDVLTIEGKNVQTLEHVLQAPEPAGTSVTSMPSQAEPDEPAPVNIRPNLARVAVALDRFARRLAARRADLERNAPAKAEASLAEERRRIEPALVAECEKAMGDMGPGFDTSVLRIVDAVLEGEPAHLAAERLLGTETI